ncbi:SNF2-related protein [Draconibacterium mangrovi]|uniref:SNF2-related protein n=1 Tax=Draconibacterium mangrovi TaxID=2697469 RepID=UPI0013D11DEC|nr:SNF2-related protein [Draconibacterium mangrovi]
MGRPRRLTAKNLEKQGVLNFDQPEMEWPAHSGYPININKQEVYSEVKTDINNSEKYLIVTGFTSLAQIIDFFSEEHRGAKTKNVRVVLGTEPDTRARKSYGEIKLSKEIKSYWLDEGYSIFKGGNVFKIINYINEGYITFRILPGLHAKLYIGDEHAILGSSNFSFNGLRTQLEANIRINEGEAHFKNISQIANNYFQKGYEYNKELIELLKQLLKVVSWQEALARAITELIDTSWFKDMPDLQARLDALKLWPTQLQGIVQALNILQEQGCVLIADPTGAGKTKMVNALKLALQHKLWEAGRKDKSYTVTVCPPLVVKNWENDLQSIRFAENNQISIGKLSNVSSIDHLQLVKEIKNANILVLDEAHNLINVKSNRSRKISENLADYIILMTATPISKRAKDLLRIVELLGVDNLSDKEIEQFYHLKNPRMLSRKEDYETLKRFIGKLMVRRTKNEINKEINKNQAAYLNKLDEPCKFPVQDHKLYETGESKNDEAIVSKIIEISKNLTGIVYLKRIEKPNFYYEYNHKEYIEKRIDMAAALAGYNIQSTLRSSKVALLEHIKGTEYVEKQFRFKTAKSYSGNFIQKINDQKDTLPKSNFTSIDLPSWLTNLQEYREVCEKELEIYQKIADLSTGLSENREQTKIKTIIDYIKKEQFVIAFDHIVVTLDYFNKLIKEQYPQYRPVVITGSTKKEKVLDKFVLGSKEEDIIALCSDSVSEGINIQQISTMIFLDMPSVLRIAEQRIGRIDRLDSPHKQIKILWPKDGKQYKLKADKRLAKASRDAEVLIGSNTDFPEELIGEVLPYEYDAKEMISQLKKGKSEDISWSGFQDAFKPVHDLYRGDSPLIKEQEYEALKGVDASVKVKVSVAESEKPWLFIALRGNKYIVPQWYFIDSNKKIYTELPVICELLRTHIKNIKESDWKSKEDKWNETTSHSLKQYIKLLQQQEIASLPNKRKRALFVAQHLMNKQLKKAQKEGDYQRKSLLTKVLRTFKSSAKKEDDFSIDLYAYSQIWLDILNPFLYLKREANRRKGYYLNDLKKEKDIVFAEEQLREILNNIPYTKQIWKNVAACIIGVKKE